MKIFYDLWSWQYQMSYILIASSLGLLLVLLLLLLELDNSIRLQFGWRQTYNKLIRLFMSSIFIVNRPRISDCLVHVRAVVKRPCWWLDSLYLPGSLVTASHAADQEIKVGTVLEQSKVTGVLRVLYLLGKRRWLQPSHCQHSTQPKLSLWNPQRQACLGPQQCQGSCWSPGQSPYPRC